ncbi:MAG: hypothetical protein D6785_00680, partial [Planctomycetota bacterium]
ERENLKNKGQKEKKQKGKKEKKTSSLSKTTKKSQKPSPYPRRREKKDLIRTQDKKIGHDQQRHSSQIQKQKDGKLFSAPTDPLSSRNQSLSSFSSNVSLASSKIEEDSGIEEKMKMGENYLREERWLEALEVFENILEKAPLYGKTYFLIGFILFKLNQYSLAKGVLKQALYLEPNHWFVYFLLAKIEMAEGNHKGGEKYLQIAKARERQRLSWEEKENPFPFFSL